MKHNDKKGKNRQIRKTSPFTKLWNPANKLLRHPSKQAIHPLHKTNFFSKLMKPCIFLFKFIKCQKNTKGPHALFMEKMRTKTLNVVGKCQI